MLCYTPYRRSSNVFVWLCGCVAVWLCVAVCRHRARFTRLRVTVLMVHTLARSFILRRQLIRKQTLLVVLQRFLRGFLVRNRLYWARVHGALLLQAAWRGHCVRQARADLVEYLASYRRGAAKAKFFRLLFAMYKGRLVRERFLVMRGAAMFLQAWARTCILSRAFRAKRWAAAVVQTYTRRLLARRRVGNIRAAHSSADDAWATSEVRDWEAVQVEVRPLAAVVVCLHLCGCSHWCGGVCCACVAVGLCVLSSPVPVRVLVHVPGLAVCTTCMPHHAHADCAHVPQRLALNVHDVDFWRDFKTGCQVRASRADGAKINPRLQVRPACCVVSCPCMVSHHGMLVFCATLAAHAPPRGCGHSGGHHGHLRLAADCWRRRWLRQRR